MTAPLKDVTKGKARKVTESTVTGACGCQSSRCAGEAAQKPVGQRQTPVIKKLLVAVDRIGHPALNYAKAMASQLNAELAVVYALEPDSTLRSESAYLYTQSLEEYAQMREQRVTDAKSLLAEIESEVSKDARVFTCLREGHVANEILSAANECGADLIVMGTHRKGALAGVFLGSTSQAVIHQGTIPVLLVDEKRNATPQS